MTIHLAPALLILAWSGVLGAARAGHAQVEIDTLPGGGRHVRNPAQGVWERQGVEPWRVVEDLRFGELEGVGHYMFGSSLDVVPDARGRLWVMDSEAYELRLFDVDGSFIRSVGRRGEGPGEFTSRTCAFAGPDDEIWVEEGLSRWQRFDTAGTYIGAYPIRLSQICGYRQWTPDGRFVVMNSRMNPVERTSTRVFMTYRMDEEGSLVPGETITPPELPKSPSVTWVASNGASAIRTLPFVHRSRRILGPSGDFWVTDGGGPYEIRREDAAGDTLLVIQREHEPIPVPADVRRRAIEEFNWDHMRPVGGFDPDDVPRTFPPFDYFFVATDGTLWVRHHRPDGTLGLEVFSPDGRYLGEIEPPEGLDRMSIRVVTPDAMYGTYRDEWDVPYIVRLAIQRPGR